jgi:hypothetical protein
MKWTKMSARQQGAARRLSDKLIAAGVTDATVSQVARHFDDVMAWAQGTVTLEWLLAETGWTDRAMRAERITARQLAERLGVSLSTAYRRIHAGVHKDARGRWVVTYIAN